MNKLNFSENCIVVTCDKNDVETYAKLICIYPWHSNRSKTVFQTSIHNIDIVLKVFRNVDASNIDKAPELVQRLFWQEMHRRSITEDLLTNGPKEKSVVTSRLTLDQHQQLGRELARVHDRFGFFYDTRTGKTPMSLSIIHDSLIENPKRKWLVVCPLILIQNAWLEDAAKFFPGMKVQNLHASTQAKRYLAMEQQAHVYLTNTESFVNWIDEILRYHTFYGCFVDESSDMKSHKSQVSVGVHISENKKKHICAVDKTGLVDFAQMVQRFYLLSGSPAPNGEWEYYSQLRSIDYFGWHQSYTQFKEYYFMDVSFNDFEDLVVRPDRKDMLMEHIKRVAMYVDKEDVLDTPGREFHVVELDLPDELKKHYTKMKNELYIEATEGKKILAVNSAVKWAKLNQITSGFIIDTKAKKENKFFDTDLQEDYVLSMYRFNALLEWLVKFGNKQIIIWCTYHKEFDIIKDLLGDKCALVYGAVSNDDKNKAIADFKCGKKQYLVANAGSADKGLTLTNAHIAIYFSLDASYEKFKQSTERIYGDKRIQPTFCDYYIFIAKGTIDAVLYNEVLQGKKEASHAILDHLKGSFYDVPKTEV